MKQTFLCNLLHKPVRDSIPWCILKAKDKGKLGHLWLVDCNEIGIRDSIPWFLVAKFTKLKSVRIL